MKKNLNTYFNEVNNISQKNGVETIEHGLPVKLLTNARELRRNQTEAENILWSRLRNRKLEHWKFRRQHPISQGFILDFYCAETKVAIELDGHQHNEDAQKLYDENRTATLTEYGIRVIRFTNDEVTTNLEAVLQKIIHFST